MEIGKNWGAVIPDKLESFQQLGEREQNAVRVALKGIRRWQVTKKEPKPMRVRATSQNSFDLRAFAGTLHELQIGITDQMIRDGDDTVVFQPRPYSKTFMPETDADRLEALNELLQRMLPIEIIDFFRRSTDPK